MRAVAPVEEGGTHFGALRMVLFRSLLLINVVAVGVYLHGETVLGWLMAPLFRLGMPVDVVTLRAAELFWVLVKVAAWGGVVAGVPWLLVELAWFARRGLYAHERRWMWGMVAAIPLLFYAGAALAWWGVVPFLLKFLLGFGVEHVRALVSVGDYVSMVGAMMLAFGVAFWLPLLIVGVVALGVVRVETLRAGRRWVIVAIFILAGIATPPDPVSQFVLAVPMLLLWEGGLFVAGLAAPRAKR